MEENVLEEQTEEVNAPNETAIDAQTAESEPQPIEANEEAISEAEEEAVDFAALAAADLAELKAQFPALGGIHSLAALSDPVRYAELREFGLSPKEAYLATGGTPRRASDNRAHLFSAVPRTSASASEPISAAQMAEARRLFSDLSDAQIYKLHKKVSN